MSRQIAFLTMDNMDGFYAYDHLAIPYLTAMNISVTDVSWRQKAVDWQAFDLVVIRSPWDYQQAPDQFLVTLQDIVNSGCPLENELAVVRWNIHKTYLRDLQSRGVDIVPTLWKTGILEEALKEHLTAFSDGQCVIKPVVGANADDTFWISPGTDRQTIKTVVNTFHNRELMMQPFVPSIVAVGEYSLFFFDGQYSHTILKTPATGDFRVQEEHGGRIQSIVPPPDLIQAAHKTIAAMDWNPLYARVDLVRLPDTTPVVIELELIEPSLYLAHAPNAAAMFADAIAARLSR